MKESRKDNGNLIYLDHSWAIGADGNDVILKVKTRFISFPGMADLTGRFPKEHIHKTIKKLK